MSDAATEAKTDVELEVYPALTSDNSKTELVEHLRDVHGVSYIKNNSITGDPRNVKVTKEDLLRYHNAIHEKLDQPGVKWQMTSNWRYDNDSRVYVDALVPYNASGAALIRNQQILLPHKHADAAVAAELREAAARAMRGEQISSKPLPEAQIRRLSELVRQDFKVLEQEMRDFAAESLEGELKEIEEEYKSREATAQKARVKLARALSDANAKLQKVRDEAAASGITISLPVITHSPSVEIKGKADAVRVARESNQRSLQRAMNRLQREQAVSLRRVQLAGISPEAQKLLDEMPDARTMMVEAALAEKPKELG